MVGQESSLIDLAPPEIQIQESIPNQPLEVESIDLIPPMVHQVFSIESGSHSPHVLLVSSDSLDLEKYSFVPVVQELTPPTPR